VATARRCSSRLQDEPRRYCIQAARSPLPSGTSSLGSGRNPRAQYERSRTRHFDAASACKVCDVRAGCARATRAALGCIQRAADAVVAERALRASAAILATKRTRLICHELDSRSLPIRMAHGIERAPSEIKLARSHPGCIRPARMKHAEKLHLLARETCAARQSATRREGLLPNRNCPMHGLGRSQRFDRR